MWCGEFIAGQPFVMDVKLDGERMMVHIKNRKMMMFTRNGSDYTDAYRQLGETVRNSISPIVTDCILDGEVCAWSQDTKSFCRFGGNAEAGREEREAYDLTDAASLSGKWLTLNKWLVFIVFDVVYIDGDGVLKLVYDACDKFKVSTDNLRRCTGEITHLPLVVRREILTNISTFIGVSWIDCNIWVPIKFVIADLRYEFTKRKRFMKVYLARCFLSNDSAQDAGTMQGFLDAGTATSTCSISQPAT
jgi:hypothetical protein